MCFFINCESSRLVGDLSVPHHHHHTSNETHFLRGHKNNPCVYEPLMQLAAERSAQLLREGALITEPSQVQSKNFSYFDAALIGVSQVPGSRYNCSEAATAVKKKEEIVDCPARGLEQLLGSSVGPAADK